MRGWSAYAVRDQKFVEVPLSHFEAMSPRQLIDLGYVLKFVIDDKILYFTDDKWAFENLKAQEKKVDWLHGFFEAYRQSLEKRDFLAGELVIDQPLYMTWKIALAMEVFDKARIVKTWGKRR